MFSFLKRDNRTVDLIYTDCFEKEYRKFIKSFSKEMKQKAKEWYWYIVKWWYPINFNSRIEWWSNAHWYSCELGSNKFWDGREKICRDKNIK